ncbi:hypothetical protein VPH35_069708 [Triticum aestivum]
MLGQPFMLGRAVELTTDRQTSAWPSLLLFLFPLPQTCCGLCSDLPRIQIQIQSAAEEARMIYRNWSLLSSTVVIWGSVGAAGLAGIFLFGGKEKFQGYLSREGERLRQQDRAMMGKN